MVLRLNGNERPLAHFDQFVMFVRQHLPRPSRYAAAHQHQTCKTDSGVRDQACEAKRVIPKARMIGQAVLAGISIGSFPRCTVLRLAKSSDCWTEGRLSRESGLPVLQMALVLKGSSRDRRRRRRRRW